MPPPLLVESWIWWSCVILIAASRFISRYMTRGWKPQLDDYCMLVAVGCYTVVVVTINKVTREGSNLFPPGYDLAALSPAERARRVYGSKLVLVIENDQIATIWLAKACLVILYLRLTTLRWQNVAIKVLLGYVVLSYVVMLVLYLGVWCRPFNQYWAIPPNSTQCNAATNHLITNAVFNLSSDVIMLAVGLPIFLRMRLPWRKKIPLVGVFSLGIFVILASILNKVYSFTEPFGSMWTYWYVRESSTALLVANLPFVWKFWRKVTGFKTSISGSASRTHLETHPSAEEQAARRKSSVPARAADPTTHWSLCDDKDDVEMDRDLGDVRRASRNGITFDEFLRDGPSPRKVSHPTDEGTSISPLTHPALLKTTRVQDTFRRDSDPDTQHSMTPVSARVLGGSWSASSFV